MKTQALLLSLLAAAFLFSPRSCVAGAQGLVVFGDPCAPGYDSDAGVDLLLSRPLADGGAEDVPAAICEGQRAPAHGVFFTTKEAAKRAAERTELRYENSALENELTKADTTTPALAGAFAGVITTAIAVWCFSHDCNPLHFGKK